MVLSLLYKASPADVRMLMIDPKMLELSVYQGIPHLLAPVVTDMKEAANGLRWCVGEMERRYKLMSAVGVRNLAGFNKWRWARTSPGDRPWPISRACRTCWSPAPPARANPWRSTRWCLACCTRPLPRMCGC